jgi:hypothetical protein
MDKAEETQDLPPQMRPLREDEIETVSGGEYPKIPWQVGPQMPDVWTHQLPWIKTVVIAG